MIELTTLQLFWGLVLCFALIMYLVLDGFDLGVGILFGFTSDEDERRSMINSIAPVWDGNETWLIVVGAGLYAAFPAAYAIFFSALYLPIVLLLVALVFRGVAFEFRDRSTRHRWLWDGGFFIGSLLVAFVQGAAIGALIEVLPVKDGQYAGDAFTWLSPFSVMTGIGLVLAYALHGSAWLGVKTTGSVREHAYKRMPYLFAAVALVLAAVFSYVMFAGLEIANRWQVFDKYWVYPILTIISLSLMMWAIKQKRDYLVFFMSVLVIVSAFAVLIASFAPYIIPYSLTLADAASAESSLSFLFWGAGLVVLPVMVLYTCVVYWMFRGRVA